MRTQILNAWKEAAPGNGTTVDDVAEKLASRFRLRIADLTAADLRIMKLIPEKIARSYNVFPLSENDRYIYMATSDPSDLAAEQAIAFASGRRPVFEIAPPDAIRETIDRRYAPVKVVNEFLAQADSEIAHAVRLLEGLGSESHGPREMESPPAVILTDLILRDAVRARASDVHLEPSRNGGAIRFRIDGVLRTHVALPIPALNRVVTRLKVIAKLDIADRLRPHDGRARVQIEHKTFDLRVSTVPTRECEKAVIRILDPAGTRTFSDLSMSSVDANRLQKLLSNREGMILVTGPTGSGKTTTLYAALQSLADGRVNVTTIEDPVEYELAGITQIQAEPKRGVTFASVLRSILRQDPDVIFVGEIRDLETAEMAVQASMTGHLVLSTLHTNDAVGVMGRLVDIGLDRASIASTLRGVIAQRLVRRICPDCGGKTCEKCGHTGYRGRVPVQETLVVDSALQDAIVKGAPLGELQKLAIAGGMRPMRDAGLAWVNNHQTTNEELERVLGDISVKEQPHVLVVDDDPISSKLARTLLEKQGYRVSQASNGDEALTMAVSDENYDLVVLDLAMPKRTGQEVLVELRKRAATLNLPVVVLTGSGDADTEIQLLEAGADDYIRKPIDAVRFTARIKGVLRRLGAEPASR